MLPLSPQSENRYSSFPPADSYAPYASDLDLLDASPMTTYPAKRPSFDPMDSSISPQFLCGSSVGTTSPSTPLNGASFDSTCMDAFRNAAPHADLQAMLDVQQDDFTEHDFGFSPVESKDPSSQAYFNPYSMVYRPHDIPHPSASFSSPSCHRLPNDALSRAIFADTVSSSSQMGIDDNTDWSPDTVAPTPSQTIDPSLAFAPLASKSPAVKPEPSTPSRGYPRSSVILLSSPIFGCLPTIVPSQYEVDDSAYFGASSFPPASTSPPYARTEHGSCVESRLSRRRYNHRGSTRPSTRRPMATKSGIDCDVVILQNSFACSYSGCIDKHTGKPKRFKRQEHKKRHEKTVHQKDCHVLHTCWVPECKRAFSRTDNLKSHLRNTHGKRSANARNRYVATLDEKNLEYYSPDWVGDLTPEGLPIEE